MQKASCLLSIPGLQVVGHLFMEREKASSCLSPSPFCCNFFVPPFSSRPYFSLLSLPSSGARSKAGPRGALIGFPVLIAPPPSVAGNVFPELVWDLKSLQGGRGWEEKGSIEYGAGRF